MNLIITDVCNRSCPYCFASHKVKLGETEVGGNHGYISLENVSIYLDFLKKSKVKELKLLGGEPTLHPEFGRIISLGIEQGFSVTVFSNGIWTSEILKIVDDKINSGKLSFVLNINEPKFQTLEESTSQKECLMIVGNTARIGFNIYNDQFDIQFIAHLIEKYSLKKSVRLGLAHPIVGSDNQFPNKESLERIGNRLIQQLQLLEQKDILGAFDCGFPICMFKEEDLGILFKCSTGFKSICSPIIDVGIDLTAWPCFPLGRLCNVNLTDFDDRDDLFRYYEEKLVSVRSLGSIDECINCKYLKRGQCSGGCIGRTIRNWEDSGSDPRLLEKLGV